LVDRASLEILGFILGGVTAVVIVIAAIAVRSHIVTTTASAAVERGAPVVPVALSRPR
jgi:hypothetical protein